MKKLNLKRLNNKGASLIAVLIAIAVVSTIGLVISQMTVTNIQMKDIEQKSKANFYDTEKMMDALAAGLNTKASVAMKESYTEMLSDYRHIAGSETKIDDEFAKRYLEKLIVLFATTDTGRGAIRETDATSGKPKYEIGYYSLDRVKAALKDYIETTIPAGSDTSWIDGAIDNALAMEVDSVGAASTDNPVKYYHADFENHIFVLQDVKVTATDVSGNKTTIKTDIVLNTPDLASLRGNRGTFKEFMRYCLIANVKLQAQSQGINVTGNVYAGHEGIETDGAAKASFTGSKTITRGDIKSKANGELNFGNPENIYQCKIYAENLKTESTSASDSAKMTVAAQAYISDDLEMDGCEDEVTLKGEYFGYNFQKNYGTDGQTPNDAEHSSAIALNGQKCKLDIRGLSKLYVAGRTFIGRNSGTSDAKDVPLGESVSAKSNQQAYFVPDSCVDNPTATYPKVDNDRFKAYMGITDPSFNVTSYLNNVENVIKYYYIFRGVRSCKLYLNFKTPQDAVEYDWKVYGIKSRTLNNLAGTYLDDNALYLGAGCGLLTAGDIMVRDSSGKLTKRAADNSSSWLEGGAVFNLSSSLAAHYYSLQRYLEDSHEGISMASVRMEDKTADPMFDVIINRTNFNTLTGANPAGFEKVWTGDDSINRNIVIIKSPSYTIKPGYTGGLIICSGDVIVDHSFKGTILAGGNIYLASNGILIESDEENVAAMIEEDMKKETPEFANIFNGYDVTVEDLLRGTSINKYLTYDNWTKSAE